MGSRSARLEYNRTETLERFLFAGVPRPSETVPHRGK